VGSTSIADFRVLHLRFAALSLPDVEDFTCSGFECLAAAMPFMSSATRELVGEQAPSEDDAPSTLTGEPLDTADKVRDFLACIADARSA